MDFMEKKRYMRESLDLEDMKMKKKMAELGQEQEFHKQLEGTKFQLDLQGDFDPK